MASRRAREREVCKPMDLSLEMSTAIRCRACSQLTPLPGLRLRWTCHGCAASLDVEKVHADTCEGGIRYSFGAYEDVLAQALQAAPGDALGLKEDAYTAPIRFRRADPVCLRCGAALGPPEPGANEIVCACGEHAPVRWADDETRRWDPRIRFVVGDASGWGDSHSESERSGSVCPCRQCGAALELEKRQRTQICEYCGARNLIGDAVYARVFPRPEDHVFYLVYQLDEAARFTVLKKQAEDPDLWEDQAESLDAQLSDDERRRISKPNAYLAVRWARSPSASVRAAGARRLLQLSSRALVVQASDVSALATDPAAEVREIYAREAKLSDAEFQALTGDSDPRVRHAVARRRDTPAEAIARLTRDADVTVRVAVARRDDPPAEALEMLASDAEAKVRLEVARRADAPPKLLASLRRDADAEVAEAAQGNPAYVPGFFARLFGR